MNEIYFCLDLIVLIHELENLESWKVVGEQILLTSKIGQLWNLKDKAAKSEQQKEL